LLAKVFADASEAFGGEASSESLKEALARMLIPNTITNAVIEKYFRKAARTGAWRALPREAKALLLASRKTVRRVRSATLARILREIFVRIELTTLKGRALYYGLLILSRRLGSIVKALKEGYLALLYAGISYLNNPPMFRIF